MTYSKIDWILDHTIINEEFESATPTDIICYLVAEYVAADGVEITHLPEGLNVEFQQIQFVYRTLRE